MTGSSANAVDTTKTDKTKGNATGFMRSFLAIARHSLSRLTVCLPHAVFNVGGSRLFILKESVPLLSHFSIAASNIQNRRDMQYAMFNPTSKTVYRFHAINYRKNVFLICTGQVEARRTNA